MPSSTQKIGQFFETSFFDNVGGLNIADSPFKVLDTQATGGINFGYTTEGAIQKRLGHEMINVIPDTQLVSRGIDLYNTTIGTKTVIRAADTKIQSVNLETSVFNNLIEDDGDTSPFPASTTTPTVFAPFNTSTVSLLNFAGNTDGIYSIYSPTNYTKNGVAAPAGSLSLAGYGLSMGAWTTSGTYRYSVSFHKIATGNESNATLSLSVAVTNTFDSVSINLAGVTPANPAVYDYGILWRSAVGGSDGFTTGDRVTTFAVAATTVNDTGSALSRNVVIPRAGSAIQDSSVLPAGTYNVLTLWKRRLVTATGSTLRFTEINQPEAWPTLNTITVPSGGPITGLAVISFNTDFGNNEYLAVFKDRELWLVRGDSISDITLSFIDLVGCPSQSLITIANGFLAWIGYSGIYIWDGSGKPILVSKTVEPLFAIDGDIDMSVMSRGCAFYLRQQNTIGWFLTSKTYGEQAICVKMDMRLTLPGVESNLSGRVIPAVIVEDQQPQAIYACRSMIPPDSNLEALILGDNSGFLYDGYSVYSDAGDGIDFQYYSPFLDMGQPSVSKRYQQVIVWVDEIGDWDLTLDYWSGYRAALLSKSTLQQPISTQSSNQAALWDVAYWDLAYWDDYTPRLRGIVFNLHNNQGNSEGDCIRLRLRNSGSDQPVTIHGYTIKWAEIAGRK